MRLYRTRVSQFGSIRKKYWIFNVLTRIVLTPCSYRRNKRIWVFGCWKGEKYDDNAKYFFEYVLRNHKETVNAFWITRSESVFKELQKKEVPVLFDKSKEARRIMLKAGIAFCTNGYDDFSNICYLCGATVICLAHASGGIKKCGFDKDRYQSRLISVMKKVKNYLFDWDYFDYHLCTSKISQDYMMQCWGEKDRSKMIITGLPRNEVFYDCEKKNMMRYKYIIYMPTYRIYNNTVVNDLIQNIKEDKLFLDSMKINGMKLIIKIHNMDARFLELNQIKSDVIQVVDENDSIDTQRLLSCSNALVTDYSSCCLDYALTDKPIFLYAPDFEEYNKVNGILDFWMAFYESETVIKSIEDLKNRVLKLINGDKYDTFLNEWIRSKYLDSSISSGDFSDRLFHFVSKNIGRWEK